ncbi:hypothetical protein KI688_007117 [Linnemannia hyalina]|uniref:Uncharacterized protein n=1 Tax=Linnemannia hyalina TaxID=64524 RepID=A0A9P8BMC6_9FUNG|nr:hypothetical protein KI688_007117 [Linnemannia hyalina]
MNNETQANSGLGALFSSLAGWLFIWMGIPRDKNSTGIPIQNQMRSQPAKLLKRQAAGLAGIQLRDEGAKTAKSIKIANAPRASAPSVNAPIANTVSASTGASSVASASSASVTVKVTPKRRAHKNRNNREITEVAQERASTLGEDEYEYESEDDQCDDADENASVSGSERQNLSGVDRRIPVKKH